MVSDSSLVATSTTTRTTYTGISLADGFQSLHESVRGGSWVDGVLPDTMSAATQAAGDLVQFTRDIVRDLICDLVARVIVWAAEALLVVTIPLVTAQIIAAVAKWCGRIFGYTGALISSLRNLTTLMED